MGKRIAIVGGGPAGSVAGVLLSRAGYEVDLYEHSRFPRNKVCGECLSAVGHAVLARMGLAPVLVDRGAVKLRQAVLHAGKPPPLTVSLPEPMWGISRGALDWLLLTHARDAGVRIHQPARVQRLAAGPQPTLLIRDLVANRITQARFDLVLLADGKGVLLGSRRAPTGDLGIKTHYADVDAPADAISLYGGLGWYGGLAPIEGGAWNVACAVPSSLVRSSRGDFDALIVSLRARNPHLHAQFHRARRIAPWLTCPLPRFALAGNWPEKVIPIGNAAAALEPIGGEGMGLAMRSAELLVDMMRHDGTINVKSLRGQFNALWRIRRISCRGAAIAVAHPWLSNLALGVGRGFPEAARLAARLMGK